MQLFAVFVVIFIGFSAGKPLESMKNETFSCGYISCNKAKDNALNVHIVSHSHDDVGWLKTVDQYYYGVRNSIQKANVKNIITSVVDALKENPERRFIQVETAFFKRWWDEQDDLTKKLVHQLVENGQLEFVGGAWSMNDEAAVHYQSIIDQFTLGLRFLNDTFGQCGIPRAAWQIDPFGHSKAMAEMFALMGYDGLFFARLDWRDKMNRLSNKEAEFFWEAGSNNNNAKEASIFTSVLYNHYSAPSGFCFDILCSDAPIISNKDSSEYNFEQKVRDFASFIRRQAANYKTNNIIITMGDDFNYQDALYYYRNLDTLISGFKIWPQKYQDLDINVFYSTPSCYVDAVKKAIDSQKLSLPIYKDDFFPYASDYHAYWTGYYSSRPTSKRSERLANNLLQIHKQLAVFDQSESNFYPMQDAVGIMQHHDAITGTEKQHVADDYAKILDKAFNHTLQEINKHLSSLLTNGKSDLDLKYCLLKNVTICSESFADNFTVVVYNPGNSVDFPVRIPVNFTDFKIVDVAGKSIPYQISPSIDDFDEIPSGKKSKYELTFIAKNFYIMSHQIYHIEKLSGMDSEPKEKYLTEDTTLGFDGGPKVTLDSHTGLIKNVEINGIAMPLKQELLYYLSAQGNNSEFDFRASGAYIFRSRYSAVEIKVEKVDVKIYKGELYHEAHQTFNSSWAKQVVRVYKDSNNIEIDWLVGPIPVECDRQGKEVISRFTTDVNSGDAFITDSNGREKLLRRRDFRSSYPYSKEEPIAGNYYPVTTQISIQDLDNSRRLSVFTDRAQGGSSLKSGELELMVHRRMLYDDAFGVGEALNEKEFGKGLKVRGTHYITITDNEKEDQNQMEEEIAIALSLAPQVFFTKKINAAALKEVQGQPSLNHSVLEHPGRILSLEPIAGSNNLIILRVENYQKSSNKEFSLSLKQLFYEFNIINLQETKLGANEWISNESIKTRNNQLNSRGNIENLQIQLKPAEIRTFIAEIAYVN